MRNKLFTLIFLVLAIYSVKGQSEEEHNEKSKAILAKVSDAYQQNVTSKFNFELGIISEDINETQKGYALIKGDSFYYKTEEREVISDGKSVWTYLPEDNE